MAKKEKNIVPSQRMLVRRSIVSMGRRWKISAEKQKGGVCTLRLFHNQEYFLLLLTVWRSLHHTNDMNVTWHTLSTEKPILPAQAVK